MSPYGRPDQPDRRGKDHSRPGGRRDDDPDLEVAKRFIWWVKLTASHKAAVTGVLMALAAAATWVAVAMMLAPRVSALEAQMASVRGDVSKLKDSEEAKMYLLCALYANAFPKMIPQRECKIALSNTPTPAF